MKLVTHLSLLLTVLPLSARTWTDATGRTMEAEFVRAEADGVVVLFRGKETLLPLAKLSESDRKWVTEMEADGGQTSATPAAGPLALGGVTLKPGGSAAIVEVPLTEETLKPFRRSAVKPSKLKMAVQLPAGFDPAKPQRVLWVSAAINNDNERKAGNCAALNTYAGTATGAGWVVIAADTDLGNPRGEDNVKEGSGDLAVQLQAIETLAAAWPGFRASKFACCGYSGGAKATFFRVGQLLSADLEVVGMFLGGCNENMTASAADEARFAKSKLRKIRVFISNGKTDSISTPAHAETLKEGVEDAFGEVQLHLFDGGHSLDRGELGKALAWFVAG